MWHSILSEGGAITNDHNVTIDTLPPKELEFGTDIFLIPGGIWYAAWSGQWRIDIPDQIYLKNQIMFIPYATGTALLARTGLLNGLKSYFE